MEKSKIKVFITVEPYNIRLAGLFDTKDSISEIRKFTMKILDRAQIRYTPGRLELKDKLAILLPEYKIGDFLSDESEVVLYSSEFGMVARTLPGDALDQRVSYLSKPSQIYDDSEFLGKKRDKSEESQSDEIKEEEAPKQKKMENKANKGKKETNKQVPKEKSNPKEKASSKEKPSSKEKSRKDSKKDESKKVEENKKQYVSDSDDE